MFRQLEKVSVSSILIDIAFYKDKKD